MTHMVAAGLCTQREVDYPNRFRLTTTYNDGNVTYSHYEEMGTAVYWAQRWARAFLGYDDSVEHGAAAIEVNDMHHPDEMMVWYGNNYEQGFTAYADTL